MLSLKQARRYLDADCELTDLEVEKACLAFGDLAAVLIDSFGSSGQREGVPDEAERVQKERMANIPVEDWPIVEERAAILQYDAGMSRKKADQEALIQYLEGYKE